MNQYYYLNNHNVPQGPHSLPELSQLMACGRVTPSTLVACKGGASWEPLGTVLSRENIEAPTVIQTSPGQAGFCPSCGHDLSPDLVGYQLPIRCPACNRALRADHPGISIWSNFVQVLRNYARFSGRAPRVEYWSFQLVNFLIYVASFLAIFIGVAIAAGLSLMSDNQQEVNIGSSVQTAMESGHVILAIYILLMVLTVFTWMMVTIIPQMALMVRRMHDVGWSGKWFLLCLIIGALPSVLALPLELLPIEDSNQVHLLILFLMLAYLASFASSVFLFVLSLLDSQHGANKYGPSSKYPLG